MTVGFLNLQKKTNLVSTKDEVIKNAERRLLHVKKLIADLKAEVQLLRSRNLSSRRRSNRNINRNIKKLQLRKSSGYFRLCDASLEQ